MPHTTNTSSSYNTLVADIGGTNIRLAVLDAKQQPPQPQHIQNYPVSQFANIIEAIETYLASIQNPHISQACIDMANPVTGDRVKLTNFDWEFSISAVKQHFKFDHFKVINDFTALALSIPLLNDEDKYQMGGKPEPLGTISLVGSGTGLGVSGLLHSSSGWYPISGEGGHVTLGATNERELALFNDINQRYGHMSAERLLSGTGLTDAYQALARISNVTPEALEPKDISQRAIDKTDPICEELMQLFIKWLGIVSADLSISLGATGGLYIGGGIVTKLGDYFTQSNFRHYFEDKGRFKGYMQAIPVYIIQAKDPALMGAAAALNSEYDALGVNG